MCWLVVGKQASTLTTHCTELRIVLKTAQQEKLYPQTDVSVSLQCHPQLLSDVFRNENLTIDINVSSFWVLHWQQWLSAASAPGEGLWTEGDE